MDQPNIVLFDDITGHLNPDIVRKIKIYSSKREYFQGIHIDSMKSKLDMCIDSPGTENMTVIYENSSTVFPEIKKFLGDRDDAYGYDDVYDLLKLKIACRYPLRDDYATIISKELVHAFQYHDRINIFKPIIITKRNDYSSLTNAYVYFNIYIVAYDFVNKEKVYLEAGDIKNKEKFGYQIIMNTFKDPIFNMKFDSGLITKISDISRVNYMAHMGERGIEKIYAASYDFYNKPENRHLLMPKRV